MTRIHRLLLGLLLFVALVAKVHSYVLRSSGGAARVPFVSQSAATKRVSLLQTSSDIISIEGLLPDFESFHQYNGILHQVRREFPLALQKPISASLLAPDIQLLVGDSGTPISLASSREELTRLQQIVIWTLRVGNLVQSPLIHCQLGTFPNNTSLLRIKWRLNLATLPQQPGVLFDGESSLHLNGSFIQSLHLETVNFNGQPQDAATIGRFLSSSRNAIQQIQNSPFLQPFLTSLTPLFDTVLSTASAAASYNNQTEAWLSESTVFVIQEGNHSSLSDSNSTTATTNQTLAARWIPLDQALNCSTDFPLPGSSSWWKYAAFHHRAGQFHKQVLPALQDGTVDEACFASDAYYITKEEKSRIRNVRRFYQTLAVGRQRSGAEWQCTGIQAMWRQNAVRVSYTTTIPSLPSLIRFQGVDVFEFNNHDPVQIANIRQVQFQNEDSSTNWDSSLLMRSLAQAVETDRPDTWVDFLVLPTPVKTIPTKQSRSDAAAIRIYRIMEQLHVDLRLLPVQNETAVIPVGNHLDETVQLTGYLNETLVKGSVSYTRSILLAVQSFKVALSSNQIKSKQVPSVRVELTEQGDVRCSLILFLQLVGVPASVSVPLTLQIDFEYRVDPDSGRIVQHRLLESRVNGQLTPGDVVSRWIKRFTTDPKIMVDEDDWIGTAFDAIKWVRSLRPE